MLRAIDISTSGLVAQRQRMTTLAGNIANASTTLDPNGDPAPFQRRFVTFEADDESIAPGTRAAGVKFQVEVDQETPARLVHDPSHPHADADGYVHYPNINVVSEFINMMDATRAYELNVAAVEMSRSMVETSLRIIA